MIQYDLCSVKSLLKTLSGLNETFKLNPALNGLYPLIQSPLEQVLMANTVSYHYWIWWSQFAAVCNIPLIDAGWLEDCLIKLNFNMPAFIRFLSVSISGKIQAASTVQARSELLIQQLVKYKSLNSFSGGYLVSGNSVKETMISYLETQLTVLAAQPSGHMMAEYKFTKLHTALSVPQLAFFTRLLVETKVLNEASQSALLKNLAAFVSTSKAPSISPESLRINYYTPNNATKNIIKEYLLQMIRLVNTY